LAQLVLVALEHPACTRARRLVFRTPLLRVRRHAFHDLRDRRRDAPAHEEGDQVQPTLGLADAWRHGVPRGRFSSLAAGRAAAAPCALTRMPAAPRPTARWPAAAVPQSPTTLRQPAPERAKVYEPRAGTETSLPARADPPAPPGRSAAGAGFAGRGRS